MDLGRVKIVDAFSDLKIMAKRHAAYTNPDYPTSTMLSNKESYDASTKSPTKPWTNPSTLALAIFSVVGRKDIISTQVLFRSDDWRKIFGNISSSLGEAEQVECAKKWIIKGLSV